MYTSSHRHWDWIGDQPPKSTSIDKPWKRFIYTFSSSPALVMMENLKQERKKYMLESYSNN